MTGVRHPEVTAQILGADGNAGSLMGITATALRRAGVPTDEINEFRREAMSGNYDHLLQTIMRWVEVE